jgi:hypothetical protein
MSSTNTQVEGVNQRFAEKQKQTNTILFYMAVVSLLSLGLGFGGGLLVGSSIERSNQEQILVD